MMNNTKPFNPCLKATGNCLAAHGSSFLPYHISDQMDQKSGNDVQKVGLQMFPVQCCHESSNMKHSSH